MKVTINTYMFLRQKHHRIGGFHMVHLMFEEINVISGYRIRHEYWTENMYNFKLAFKENSKINPAPFAVFYTYPKE